MNKVCQTPDWVRHTNVYEVNLRQYSGPGTIKAFEKELPRLQKMGVTTLWFMPLTPIAQKNKKGSMGSYYACSDYTDVSQEFGTLQDFHGLVQQAHAFGFKVILDWVANHTGWDHVWTVEHPEWYEKDAVSGDFKKASGMDDIIELDFSNPEMRKAMIGAMQFWVRECDIDGFRCDLAAWVELFFWQEARPIVDAIKPLFWLGEFDEFENPDYMTVFDASYSWAWMHKTRDFYQHRLPLYELDPILDGYHRAAQNGSMQIWFTTNHDENSWNGTEYDKYGDLAPALAVFSFTWSGIPLIYSGQELPNRKKLAFFEKDPIEWTGVYALEDFYRTLLHLHTSHPALAAGDIDTLPMRFSTTVNDKVYAYARKSGDRELLVIINFSDHAGLALQLNDDRVSGRYLDIFSGQEKDFDTDGSLVLNAWGYAVYVK
ncbi:MAG: 1,4-alpha-glucan branching protein [Terrimonas sp.]|nr:1,4-alpha-glucan branching protein [Terrimonas sp.]